jgi:hypothetical protein
MHPRAPCPPGVMRDSRTEDTLRTTFHERSPKKDEIALFSEDGGHLTGSLQPNPGNTNDEGEEGREDADSKLHRQRVAAETPRDFAVERRKDAHNEDRGHAEGAQIGDRLAPVVQHHCGQYTQDAAGPSKPVNDPYEQRHDLHTQAN